jgi:PKD repeat protein
LTIAMALVFVALTASFGSARTDAATPAVAGYQDFAYGEAPGGDDVTAGRVQSKLWTNDGKWWGVLFDIGTVAQAQFRIWKFDMTTQNWTNTNVLVDNRNRSHADVLSDGNTLYVVSSRSEDETGLATGRDVRIYRYSYNTTTDTYVLSGGFPKTLAATAAGTSYPTIAKDSSGVVWVAFTQANRVKISSSTDNAVTWSAPIDLPTMGNDVTGDDVAAIASMTGGVGVLWSNESADDSFYFAAHKNADPAATWQARETAFGTASAFDADGHLSVKTDASGNILAAIKTGRNEDPAPNGGDPLISVLKRTGAVDAVGTWVDHTVTTVTVGGTRPILVLDAESDQANVFLTDPTLATDGDQAIYRRTAPLGTLSFGSASIGTAFIDSATKLAINDPTSTKQITQAATGMIVAAVDEPTLTYFHGCAGAVCPDKPVANFSGTPLTGPAPLTVDFTDSSTNAPTSWSWTFGDGGVSTAQNPSHLYADAGTYTVTLTAANVAGSDVETKTAYVTVQAPLENTYFTLPAPVRVLDSRPGGTGLSGVFSSGVHRTLSIAGANGIPADAVAITGNLTVSGQTKAGFLSVTPDPNDDPTTSNLNFPLGDTRANGVTVPLNVDGDLSITYGAGSPGTTHVILDVTGYFRESAAGTSYSTLDPKRVLDTRPGGTGLAGAFVASVPRTLSIADANGIPAAARAITANLTVVGQSRAGFLSITPTSQANPTTSSLNFPLGDTRANGVTVPLNGSGDLWIVYKTTTGTGTAHVLLDVTGYFLDGTAGATFVPVTPARILDTRDGTGLAGPFVRDTSRHWPVVGQGGIGTGAVAVVGNVTVVGQTKAGFVSLTPALTPNPTTSTINFPLGDVRANNFTVKLSPTGELFGIYKATSAGTTALIVDVTGYYK